MNIRHSPYKYTYQDMSYIYLNRDGRRETSWEDFREKERLRLKYSDDQ